MKVNGRFPTPDSNGLSKARRQSGLSWWVYLLPYLRPQDQDLYKQFRLDEPWDSPHNKKLIVKMPAVFEKLSSPSLAKKGKTCIHVIVGNNNTPFGLHVKGKSVGPHWRIFLDGTMNTILAVEAGDDKAEVWTKPGGLPFDPKADPFALLGHLDDDSFCALFFDGEVFRIKTSIPPDVFRRLIQHDDNFMVGARPDFVPNKRVKQHNERLKQRRAGVEEPDQMPPRPIRFR